MSGRLSPATLPPAGARCGESPPPPPRGLRPRAMPAVAHVALNLMLLGGGVALAAKGSGGPLRYLLGQTALALGFCQAFALMHEAGHGTLFRRPVWNALVGHAAGFLCLIPYAAWRPVHARHHRYTGWQDLDATTASLVPRPLSPWEVRLIDAAWRFWLPLFSLVYRVQNFWRAGRLSRFPGVPVAPGRLRAIAALHLAGYAGLVGWWGVGASLLAVGPGLVLALMAQDILLLSQHTHMPTRLANGRDVRPHPPREQGPFTRSLRLPGWLSLLLLHFDAHELHHLYPAVPGYLLRRIPYAPPNEVNWLAWLRQAKALRGSEFLFGGPRLAEAAP